ncbi:BolA family transcriptional regulator [Maricaulis sp.]|uniref:BolA family protein n=1 Tax=Maricaulis sp. TaxID=1486257 RepID=UPI001B1C74EF|nr:BolA family protein [Maricaulis sp.]MBO6766023.1 BolA family transcriptional regulator [Maricaulis sp.]
MSMRDTIQARLEAALSPQQLDVRDDSHLHAGHAGARPGGESHFTVEIVADAFAGRSRVERHRLVNEALSHELAGQIHALVIRARAPGE